MGVALVSRGLPSGYVNLLSLHIHANLGTKDLQFGQRTINWIFLLLSQKFQPNHSLSILTFQVLASKYLFRHNSDDSTHRFISSPLPAKASSSFIENWYSLIYLFIERQRHYTRLFDICQRNKIVWFRDRKTCFKKQKEPPDKRAFHSNQRPGSMPLIAFNRFCCLSSNFLCLAVLSAACA